MISRWYSSLGFYYRALLVSVAAVALRWEPEGFSFRKGFKRSREIATDLADGTGGSKDEGGWAKYPATASPGGCWGDVVGMEKEKSTWR